MVTQANTTANASSSYYDISTTSPTSWTYVPYSITPSTSDPSTERDKLLDTKTIVFDKDGHRYILTLGEIYEIEIGCSNDKKNRRKFESLTSKEIRDFVLVERI